MLRIAEQAHKTDTGRQRNANEDSYFARAPVFAVADGMGGAQAGEVASSIAARAFEEEITEGESPERQLKDIAQRANAEIHELAEKDPSRAGMGTTLTTVLLSGSDIAIAHVGDSRAYLLRDGGLKRLTKDHSLVEELRRQGRLTEEEAEEHPQRSIITRALGPEAKVKIDTMSHPARGGDIYLLCSDGLTTMVGEEQIQEVLSDSRSLKSAVSRLIELANENGGRDNITAVAFRVEDDGKGEDEKATLIGATAEQAGLSADKVKAAARRMRPGAPPPATLPAESNRRKWLRRGAFAAAALLVIGAAIFIVRQVYFVGSDSGGRVALYRGLPYDLPLGVDFYSKQYAIPVQLSALSAERQRVVTDHKLRGHGDAVDILDDIEQREGSVPPVPATPAAPTAPVTPAPSPNKKKKHRSQSAKP
ncbi:MAG: Stp1/IreP family PP2C-type Ser/Thr phosphatase [Solirubrobacterales bacterium]